MIVLQIACLVCLALIIILLAVLLSKSSHGEDVSGELRASRMETHDVMQKMSDSLRDTLVSGQKTFAEAQSRSLHDMNTSINDRQGQLQKSLSDSLKVSQESTKAMTDLVDVRLKQLQEVVDKRLQALEEKNDRKLTEMKQVVDEKLQTTLEERISKSFKEVSERLEQVYKGLGEMQTLALGVGDLKKVLSGVKTRGILGEIQLGAILCEILAPEQYETNVITVKGTQNPVEFAVKLPGMSEGEHVFLPIDSKFPADAYAKLCDAYDAGNPEEVQSAQNELIQRIKGFAKDIRSKYICVPDTTDFAIMFLPTEGLYAEVVRMGLVEVLQADYRITVAGPTTMAALLNSLQMGFRTLAIQKRSGEVWRVLGEVKHQFMKFETTLTSAQKRLAQANDDLENLVGTRTRMLMSKLKSVEALPEDEDIMRRALHSAEDSDDTDN